MADDASNGKKKSLQSLAVRGSAFQMLSYGTGEVLRLASNLVLARLLFPEAFGLTALVSIIMQGLEMLSDVGLQASIIQNERGDDPAFLNTAWTIQVVRGIVLWLIAVLLAWPVALIYDEPQLVWLIPVGSFSVALLGFHSTSIFTLRRRLRIGTIAIIDLASRVACVAVMIVWALISPSVWALVAGGLTASLCRMIGSYLVDVGYRNRFHWDPESARAIVSFGKWIFGSSAVFFIGRQGDRLLLGRLLGVSVLGIYSIAGFLSEAVGAAITQVTHGVFYPIFSQVSREGRERLREVYYKTRLRLDALSLTSLGGLMVLGPWVVDLLYDERYEEAGWMLSVLCIRVAMDCMLATCETCLFSIGQTHWALYRSIGRAVWILVGIPIGYKIAGIHGIVWATGLSEIPVLLILWPAFFKAGMLRLHRELLAVCFFAVGAGLGFLVKPVLEMLSASLSF
jgi:O-antigen/teichoic acid export membrane protein